MISRTEIDIASGITLANDVYGNYDPFSRPQSVTHLEGTTEWTYYSCCGVDMTVDRDGVTNLYYYDAANRQVASLRNGIVLTNVLDSVGHTLETILVGSDGSQIVLGRWQYDTAGRLIAQVNAVDGVTSYAESHATTGGLVRTTTNPDGSTIIDAYYLDGTLKQRTGTGVHGIRYVTGAVTAASYSAEIKLNPDGSDTLEVVTNFSDALGRNFQTMYGDGSSSQSFYNNLGQLSEQMDPDGVTTFYQYNARGQLAYTTNDPSGEDRITLNINDVTNDHGANVLRSRTYVWGTSGSDSSNLVSTAETSTDGLKSWQTQYRDANTPVTSLSQTVYGANRFITNTAPDNSYSVSVYSSGMLVSTTRYLSPSNQIGATTYGYDAHGRQRTVTDARNGPTSYTYNNADMVVSVTTPNPGGVGSAQTTTTFYNALLQAANVLQPDGTSVTMIYLPTGELGQTFGSRTYPVQYTYDYDGRVKTMTTWQNFNSPSGPAVTTWNYDPYHGFLTNKVYNNNTGPSYTYTYAGRLLSRTWARGTNAAYTYNSSGSLSNVNYNDGVTSSITYSYDRLGRISSVVHGPATISFAYDWANDVLSDSYAGGLLHGLAVTNAYDAVLRRTAVGLSNFSSTLVQFGYDNASRLQNVTNGSTTIAYNYLANSPLVSQITFQQSGTTRMTTTKQYDDLNRLSSISSSPSNSFSYQYTAANQRNLARLADGSYWRYGYDALGQVVSGRKYWSDGTPVAGQRFDYAFDTIGNRTQTQAGGDQTGANLRLAHYTNNLLNQITSRDVPGYVDIMGDAIATNTVFVNGSPAYQKVEYFRAQLSVTNTLAAQWQNVTVSNNPPGQGSVTGHLFVPVTPEAFSYDADGNLTQDGRWTYTWDGENRLVNMTSLTNAPGGSQLQLSFVYDYQGRRIQKLVATNSPSGGYVGEYTNNCVYDGWNLLAELAPISPCLFRL